MATAWDISHTNQQLGDVRVNPTINIGGIGGSPLRSKGLGGVDPITLAVVGALVLTLVMILRRKL